MKLYQANVVVITNTAEQLKVILGQFSNVLEVKLRKPMI